MRHSQNISHIALDTLRQQLLMANTQKYQEINLLRGVEYMLYCPLNFPLYELPLKGDRLKTFFRKKKCSGITKVFLIIKPWLKLVPVFGKQDMVNKMYFYFQKVLLNIK